MCEQTAARLNGDIDVGTVERSLRDIENGIAVLYELCRGNDDEDIAKALFFTACHMGEEVKRAQKALGLDK